jgi:hypothetical protein
MTPSRMIGFTLPVLGAVIFILGAPSASAEPAAWDQSQVTELAQKFFEAAKSLRDADREAPDPIEHAGSGAAMLFTDDLLVIESEAAHLHNELKAGKGRSETSSVYRQLAESMQRAHQQAKRLTLTMPVSSALKAADDALNRLEPYYDGVTD